ncbi:membrane-spanning 4-domains subfamily A member 5 [Bos indicus x Bos taurus]|uniref:Membrane-spanning 4-domains, subfamily A, member 5 n=2 Tax=Bos TaxID=9903 RepID=Q2KII2_BOVIN|nr:membrane-spanning 4-domains subfamily A member 5 [Bos taurus]XP_019830193.1 PREDICTED: membrane-spanning 4-domains subfamily A member 5 [Bos indicus]XP_027417533.1 membrane-spanning 4-domains subfamily A member 5 [Bos indicus x Bos taurus]AAI12629.1 Membrane-spanning 4-domains, subfamily A, member 5 [Bos taurus]DAA21568.1 TPA: membrane-spanning 4-domains, subfamily A, member 5 [Bos taurus]
MDSRAAHSPVFLVFPPDITMPEFQSGDITGTTYDSSMPFPKLLATRMKILGAVQILLGAMNFSFGTVLLFTLEDPYPRFPFIFISGYPFWSSILFVNSGAFLVALERKTTETLVTLSRIMNSLSAVAAAAGIILLIIGFLIDRDFLCGYSGEVSECHAVTTLFIGILIMLMAFSIIEFLISLSFSVMRGPTECGDCEEWDGAEL